MVTNVWYLWHTIQHILQCMHLACVHHLLFHTFVALQALQQMQVVFHTIIAIAMVIVKRCNPKMAPRSHPLRHHAHTEFDCK